MFMKAMCICFCEKDLCFVVVVVFITNEAIVDNAVEQYGFYARLREAKKEHFPLLCYITTAP